MKELEQAVAAAFSNIAGSGFIEKSIEEQLSKSIGGIIKSQLESYSDFGKQLGEHVKQALQVDFSGLGLPGYNDLILKIVRKQVDAEIGNQLAVRVEKQLSELLKPAPAQITFSQLVEQFIEYNKNDGCACAGEERITLLMDESQHGSRWISMDKRQGRSEYDCDIRFGVRESEGNIFALRLDRREVDKTLFVGSIYGFERTLFQMHAAGTKLIIDAETSEIDTSYPGHND